MYNMLYTARPVIAMAVFDQDVSAETSARYPPLYEPGMRDMSFNRLKFAASAWQGLWTSFVLVAITLGISPSLLSTPSLPSFPLCVVVSHPAVVFLPSLTPFPVFFVADWMFALRYTAPEWCFNRILEVSNHENYYRCYIVEESSHNVAHIGG